MGDVEALDVLRTERGPGRVEGDPSAFRFAALCAREGRLTAGIAFNRRSTIRRMRQLLADDTSLATASELLNRLETAA